MHSIVLTKLLVNMCNTIIKEGFYVNRYTKIFDIIIEKEKGLILGKLRVIQFVTGVVYPNIKLL